MNTKFDRARKIKQALIDIISIYVLIGNADMIGKFLGKSMDNFNLEELQDELKELGH